MFRMACPAMQPVPNQERQLEAASITPKVEGNLQLAGQPVPSPISTSDVRQQRQQQLELQPEFSQQSVSAHAASSATGSLYMLRHLKMGANSELHFVASDPSSTASSPQSACSPAAGVGFVQQQKLLPERNATSMSSMQSVAAQPDPSAAGVLHMFRQLQMSPETRLHLVASTPQPSVQRQKERLSASSGTEEVALVASAECLLQSVAVQSRSLAAVHLPLLQQLQQVTPHSRLHFVASEDSANPPPRLQTSQSHPSAAGARHVQHQGHRMPVASAAAELPAQAAAGRAEPCTPSSLHVLRQLLRMSPDSRLHFVASAASSTDSLVPSLADQADQPESSLEDTTQVPRRQQPTACPMQHVALGPSPEAPQHETRYDWREGPAVIPLLCAELSWDSLATFPERKHGTLKDEMHFRPCCPPHSIYSAFRATPPPPPQRLCLGCSRLVFVPFDIMCST